MPRYTDFKFFSQGDTVFQSDRILVRCGRVDDQGAHMTSVPVEFDDWNLAADYVKFMTARLQAGEVIDAPPYTDGPMRRQWAADVATYDRIAALEKELAELKAAPPKPKFREFF